jgi:hypothetical protein
VLRYLSRAVALFAAFTVSLPARSATADVSSPRSRSDQRSLEAPAPSASDAGWFGLSVGIGKPTLRTKLAAAEPSAGAEGSVGSAGNYRLLYEKQLVRWLGVRGFMSVTEWGTAQSEHSGDGDRALYDLGGAPVLSFGVGRDVSLFAFVPISFSWSSAPARAPRQVVLESMDVGTGYRIGVGAGMLVRLSSAFGLLFELEGAAQHVTHVRSYGRADGSGDRSELPIAYDLRWLGVELGIALFP